MRFLRGQLARLLRKKKAEEPELLTRKQMASLLDVRVQQFDKKYRPLIPHAYIAKSGTGKEVLFKRQAVRAILDALVFEEKERAKLANDDALLLDGNDKSPSIERLRLAKAKLAELELAEKRGQLIRPDLASTALLLVAGKLRKLGTRLGKKYGPAVSDDFERTLDECQNEMERTIDDASRSKTNFESDAR